MNTETAADIAISHVTVSAAACHVNSPNFRACKMYLHSGSQHNSGIISHHVCSLKHYLPVNQSHSTWICKFLRAPDAVPVGKHPVGTSR